MAHQAYLHRSKQPRICNGKITLLRSAVQNKNFLTEGAMPVYLSVPSDCIKFIVFQLLK